MLYPRRHPPSPKHLHCTHTHTLLGLRYTGRSSHTPLDPTDAVDTTVLPDVVVRTVSGGNKQQVSVNIVTDGINKIYRP